MFPWTWTRIPARVFLKNRCPVFRPVPATWTMSGEGSSSSSRDGWNARRPEPLSLRSSFSATRFAESLRLPSSPTFSLDQLSVYARRASNSSINIMSSSATTFLQHAVSLHGETDDNMQAKNAKVYENAQTSKSFWHNFLLNVYPHTWELDIATHEFENTIKSSFNDASLGLHRVSEHIHRKVPQIAESKAGLRDIEQLVETANSDMLDARRVVEDLECIESFRSIAEMVKTSLTIVKAHKSS